MRELWKMKSKVIFIIGRFQPFHLGHLAIIKKYYLKGYKIKVGIGSSQHSHTKRNPFTIHERETMIRLAFKDKKIRNYKIYYIPDINNNIKYAQHVEKIVGHFDILFTGNKTVKKIFDKYCSIEGCKIHHFSESKSRVKGIKASDIRKKWLSKESKKDISKSVFEYLKKIDAKKRLKNFIQ